MTLLLRITDEALYKGPQLTLLIFDILIRFRTYAIALKSDIEKAFHQVSDHENDREFLRLLWFDIFSDQPKIVRSRFAGVIFRVTCSLFLLNEVIRKLAKKFEFDIDFVNKIFDCFYIDYFTGDEGDFYKALDLLKKLKLRFLDGHFFHLRKWRTNDPKSRKIISEDASNSLQPKKILGILRKEVDDMLVFDFSKICETYNTLDITKRSVLKILAMSDCSRIIHCSLDRRVIIVVLSGMDFFE